MKIRATISLLKQGLQEGEPLSGDPVKIQIFNEVLRNYCFVSESKKFCSESRCFVGYLNLVLNVEIFPF